MIKANDISTLLGEDYDENPRFMKYGWREDAQFEPVAEEYDELAYMVSQEEATVRIDNVGTFEHVVTWGGEGDGAEIGNVIRFTDSEGNVQHFEQTGTYSSWDSTYFDEWHEVQPFEKTVIRYRRVK